MSSTNTLRATLLAGLIALGSTVSSDAAGVSHPFLGLVQSTALQSAEVLTSMAARSLNAVSTLFRGI